jgi:type II secretory pathway pseudopilin PulG
MPKSKRALLSHPGTARSRASGFTLFELAISMLIITLLATVLLTPITTQVTQARISQAKTDLDQINEALIGFALAQSRPRLPCPDTTGDGLEDACANSSNAETTGGNVPWATLNVPATDPWGQRYQYRVNNAFTPAAGFTLATVPNGACANGTLGTATGIIKVCGDTACTPALVLTNVTTNPIPALIFSRGPNGAVAPASADEAENVDNDCVFVSRTYSGAAGSQFDDLLVWMSPGILMSRMVTAQKLP